MLVASLERGLERGALQAAERIERKAYRELFLAAPPELALRHGIETAEVGGATCTVAAALDAGLSMFNRAIGLGLERPVERTDLDAIGDWFAARDADLHVQVAPATGIGLEDLLAASGYEPAYAWMKFVRGPEPPFRERSPLRVRAIGESEAAAFAGVVAAGFALPPLVAGWLAPLVGRERWRCYLARDGEAPAGAAALYVAGGVAWLGLGTVLPAHRGKGAQRALFAARIRDAIELGARLLVTETGERAPGRPGFSYANILASGFEEAHRRSAYVRRPR
jgi:hypothetical protein